MEPQDCLLRQAEPMTMSLPTALRPTSPRPTPRAEFLPGFLMGDLPAPTTLQPGTGPPRGGGGSVPQPVVPTARDTTGAPPVRSIRDDLVALSPRQPLTPRTGTGVQQLCLSPAQVDPFYSQGESLTSDDQLDQTWITVFGFPPGSASYIEMQFTLYGTILRHKIPSSGNWMHLQYQSRLQARKALSKNGMVFGDDIMLGVRPCIDKSVMNSSTAIYSGLPPSRYAGMRPLCPEGYRGSGNYQVEPDRQLSRRDDSIFSKLWEYLFGW